MFLMITWPMRPYLGWDEIASMNTWLIWPYLGWDQNILDEYLAYAALSRALNATKSSRF